MGRNDQSGRWCILRCAAPSTLRLAASLQDAGLDAWTPIDTFKRRVPRGKATEYVTGPLTPTFVFVRADWLPVLRRMEKAIGSPHPRFSVFRYLGATVYVRHAALHPLREHVNDAYVASLPCARTFKKPRGAAYEVGDKLKLKTGSFAGLECTVESSDGRTTTVGLKLFGRSMGLPIPTFQLRADRVAPLPTAA